MKSSQKKSLLRFSSGFFWIGVFLFVFLLIGFADLFSKKRQVQMEIDRFKNEITDLNKKNEDILHFIDYLNSEMFVEESAREKLNLGEPGETVVIIQDENNSESGNNTKEKNLFHTNREKWWKYFFH